MFDPDQGGKDPEAAALEELLSSASPGVDDGFLDFLLGDDSKAPELEASKKDQPATRLRLFNDRDFLREGYRYLADSSESNYVPLEEHNSMTVLTAPHDLQRRLGAAAGPGEVIFGATAIPSEAWPDNGRFQLTDDPDRVNVAIKAARNLSGYWSSELLCTDQHPILNWVKERLLMLVNRGQCPHITSRKLQNGEICFCCIGQISSKAGVPIAVDAHAISFTKGGGFQHRSLGEALDAAGFGSLMNEGKTGNIAAAQALIPSAIDASLKHMRELGLKRQDAMLGPLRAEERRLKKWSTRRRELLEDRLEQLPENHRKARQYKQQLQDMEGYLKDRKDNWVDTYFTTTTEPSTQLVLVIEGVN